MSSGGCTDRATAEWAKYAFKMSREHGASYIAVLQHLGDLRSVDSDTRAIAYRLLADSETRIVYRQPPDQAAALRHQRRDGRHRCHVDHLLVISASHHWRSSPSRLSSVGSVASGCCGEQASAKGLLPPGLQ